MIQQHKSSRAFLPRETYSDVLACPDRSTAPPPRTVPPETVCCPCLGPADRGDASCSQTARPVSAAPSLETWQGEPRPTEQPRTKPACQPSGPPCPLHTYCLPLLGSTGHKSKHFQAYRGSKGTACTSSSSNTRGVAECQVGTVPVPSKGKGVVNPQGKPRLWGLKDAGGMQASPRTWGSLQARPVLLCVVSCQLWLQGSSWHELSLLLLFLPSAAT